MSDDVNVFLNADEICANYGFCIISICRIGTIYSKTERESIFVLFQTYVAGEKSGCRIRIALLKYLGKCKKYTQFKC